MCDAKKAREDWQLRQEFFDYNEAVTEDVHWARREIKRLESQTEDLKASQRRCREEWTLEAQNAKALEEENIQLKERVQELEVIEQDSLEVCACGEGYWFFGTQVHCMACGTTINGTKSAEALRIRDAEVAAGALEKLANNGNFDGAAWQIGDLLIDEANRIREEAKR